MDRIDLTDLDLFEHGDPHAAWRRLRAAAPIHWNDEVDGPGFWALTCYEDIVQCYRNTRSLTSEKGMLLGVNRGEGDPAAGKMLVVTDPPRHRQLRRILDSTFSARLIARKTPQVQAIVQRLVDARVGSEVDFATDIAANIPVAAICAMLGVPESDQARLLALTTAAFGSEDEEYRLSDTAGDTAGVAHFEIFEYLSGLVSERRRALREDLISLLLTAEFEGSRLDEEAVLLNCLNLLIGGNETTRHAATGGILALAGHGDQWATLAGSPEAVPAAVEEILRWTSPGMYVLRTAREDVAIRDHTIREGQAVTLWNISANRDEAVFADPFTFDVTRHPNRHLAFGIGEHFCLGSSLARLELRLLLEALLARVAEVEIVGPPRKLRSNLVNGIKHLPVRLRAR